MEDQQIISQEGDEQVDSDLEEDTLDAKKSGHTMVIEFDDAKVPDGSFVLLCNGGCAKSLTRIIFDDNLESIGSVKVTPKKDEKDLSAPKEEEVLLIYLNQGVVILHNSGVTGQHCGEILDKLWPVFFAKNCKIVGMSSVYKTNYSTSEGSIMIDSDEPLPLKYTKSNHADAAIDGFLAANAKQISADNQFNATSGLTAALLMEAEMTGKSAITFKAIFDEHFITLETLRAFQPVVNDLVGLKVDFSNIQKMKEFRSVLKDSNAKKNGIFS